MGSRMKLAHVKEEKGTNEASLAHGPDKALQPVEQKLG
jgi:hypothetical protein